MTPETPLPPNPPPDPRTDLLPFHRLAQGTRLASLELYDACGRAMEVLALVEQVPTTEGEAPGISQELHLKVMLARLFVEQAIAKAKSGAS